MARARCPSPSPALCAGSRAGCPRSGVCPSLCRRPNVQKDLVAQRRADKSFICVSKVRYLERDRLRRRRHRPSVRQQQPRSVRWQSGHSAALRPGPRCTPSAMVLETPAAQALGGWPQQPLDKKTKAVTRLMCCYLPPPIASIASATLSETGLECPSIVQINVCLCTGPLSPMIFSRVGHHDGEVRPTGRKAERS